MERFEYKIIISDIGTDGGYGPLTPKAVTIHHSAVIGRSDDDDIERFKTYAQYHQNVMPYHIAIPYAEDNTIYITQYFNTFTIHNGNYEGNRNCLAVLVDGNFQEQEPQDIQLKKLDQVLQDIDTGWFEKNGYSLSRIDLFGPLQTYSGETVPPLHYHNEVAQPIAVTACCGKNLIPKVVEYREKEGDVSWSNSNSVDDDMYQGKSAQFWFERKEHFKNQAEELESQVKDLESGNKSLAEELVECQKGLGGTSVKTLQSLLDKCRLEKNQIEKMNIFDFLIFKLKKKQSDTHQKLKKV